MNSSLDKQILAQLAELTSAGVPLEAGLRVAAEETGDSRTARQLRSIADRMRAGEELAHILSGKDVIISAFVRAAIRSGIASRDLGVLLELSQLDSARRDLRRRLAMSLTYPLLLIILLASLLVLTWGYLLPAIYDAFLDADEWGSRAAASMNLLRWVTESGARYAGLGLLSCLVLAGLTRLVLGPARWRWLLTSLPVFGPIMLWEAVWDFATRLRLLISRHVPLPEALRMVGDELRDANLADLSRRFAAGTADGRSLRELMQGTTRVPATLTAVLGWGEQHDALGDALESAAEIFHGRLRLRSALLASILPPLVYVVVAALAVVVVTSFLLPLLIMIQDLSSFAGLSALSSPQTHLPLLGANWLGLTFLGAILWWIVHLLFLDQQHPPDNFLPFALRVTALSLIFFGATGLIFSLALPLAIPTVMAMLIVAAMVANRFRVNETRALLWQLNVARNRGMPLIPAARAFGAERTDDLGIRTLRMVEQMEQGVPFPAALAAARLPTTTETALAARIGLGQLSRTSHVDHNLARSSRELDESTALLQRLIYFCCVTAFGAAGWLFLWTSVLPTYQQIFADFGVELPGLTRTLFGWSASPAGSLLLVLGTVTALVMFLTAIPAMFYYIGWLRWEPPVIRPVTARYHGALILRVLADAVDQQRSLRQSLSDITTAYPIYYVRQRLVSVMEAVELGHDWIEALQRERLISDVTRAVLKSADRIGNLPWALREMADSAFRRVMLRVQAAMQIITPLILLAIAIPIGLVVIAMFAPLPNLILQIMSSYE